MKFVIGEFHEKPSIHFNFHQYQEVTTIRASACMRNFYHTQMLSTVRAEHIICST